MQGVGGVGTAGDDRCASPVTPVAAPDLQVLIDSAPVLVRVAGPDGEGTFFNRPWLEFTGRAMDQELGYGWIDAVHPHDRARCTDRYLGVVAVPEPLEVEYRLRRADGSWRWILDRGAEVADCGGGVHGYIAACIDITDRRHAEEELRQSREELRLALSAGSMGSWVWDRRSGRVLRDAGLDAIYGVPDGTSSGDFDEWVSLVHPDDRSWVIEAVERAVVDGGTYEFEHRIVRPDGSVRWIERRGQAYWDSDGEVAGTRGLVVDITARKQAEAERDRLLAAEQLAHRAAQQLAHRLANLQAVTADLADARTVDEVARVIVGRGTKGMEAASGALCILSEDGGHFDVIGHVGYDPDAIASFRRFPAGALLPAADAVHAGQMVLLGSIEERDDRYPNLKGRQARNQSFATVPLIVGSRPIGAVALGWAERREFSDEDRRFLTALAQQAAQAMDRANFYQAEHLTAQRQTLLASASRALGASLQYQDTLAEVARLAVPDIADDCRIHIIEDYRVGVAAHATAYPVSTGEPPVRDQRADTDRSLLQSLQRAEPVVLPTVETGVLAAQPGLDHLGPMVPIDACSVIAVPLRDHERTLGMLVLAMTGSRRRYGAADLSLAEDLAARISSAVANARSHRIRTEVAHTLQRSLLPPNIPLLPGLDLAARYHPIGDGSEVGGDFYDIFPAGGGRWGVVIGDVSGKGVSAASLTALARYTIRTAARRESSPSAVLRILNDGILDHDAGERFATIAHALIEHTSTGVQVLLSRAGHLPPLLVDPDGSVCPVGRSGTAVGLFGDPVLHDDLLTLHPGQVLILCTDGLIEARSPEGVFADGLVEAVAGSCCNSPAATIADTIQEALLEYQGGRARDDMALLVVRHPPGIFHEHFAPRPEAVGSTRHRLANWLAKQRREVAAVADEVLLVATELTTNAVRVARREVQLHVWVGEGGVTIDVADDGPGFDRQIPAFDTLPNVWSGSGRGLYIVHALMDGCEVQSGPSATVLRCTKRV